MAIEEKVDLTVYLACPSRKQAVPGSAADLDDLQGRRVSYEELERERAELLASSFDPIDKFVRAAGGRTTAIDPLRRQMHIELPVAQGTTPFAQMRRINEGDHLPRHQPTEEGLTQDRIPGGVLAVLGMDKREYARKSRLRRVTNIAPMISRGLYPVRIAALYGLNSRQNAGAGQCIAIIEPAGGYRGDDLAAACRAMNISVPDITDISVLGGRNAFGQNPTHDKEVTLDVQVVAGVSPKARIAVYFTNFSERGLAEAVFAAIYDKINRPNIVVITWGEPETSFPLEARVAMDSALADAVRLGITVVTASGDGLATDRVTDGRAHVDYPASSPYVLSCGGSAITLDQAGNSISDEVVWNEGLEGTGGGISDLYPVPAYQGTIALPGSFNDGGKRRGVPDVAAAASMTNGYNIVLNGVEEVASGTSAAAPLWAGLIALINADRGGALGFLNSHLYQASGVFRPIISGDNIPRGTTIGYRAASGWNACTGLGTPIGPELFRHLIAIA